MRAYDAARSSDQHRRVARVCSECQRLEIGPGREGQLNIMDRVSCNCRARNRDTDTIIGGDSCASIVICDDTGKRGGGRGLKQHSGREVIVRIDTGQADVSAVANDNSVQAVGDLEVEEGYATGPCHRDGIVAIAVDDRSAHALQGQTIGRDHNRTRTDAGKADRFILAAGISDSVGEGFLAAIERGLLGRRDYRS